MKRKDTRQALSKIVKHKRLADFGNNYKKACDYFTSILAKDRNAALVYAERGIALFNRKKYLEATRDIVRAVKLGPGNPEVRFWAGYAASHFAHDSISALRHLDAAIRLNDHYTNAYAWRSKVWAGRGQNALALEDIDKAIALKKDCADFHRFRAVDLYNLGLYQKSISAYDEAIKCDPQCGFLYYNRAETYMAMDSPAHAYTDFKNSERLGEKTWNMHYLMGLAMERIKKKKAAIEYYKQATMSAPSLPLERIENLEQGRDGRSKRRAFVNYYRAPYKDHGSVELWLSELHGMWNVSWFMKDYACEYVKEKGEGHIIVKVSTRAGKDYTYWFKVDGKGK